MNEVTQQEFFARVGAHGHREVVELADWLLSSDSETTQRDLELNCRFAPSIITRSEVEVFGMSEPRFAIRIYLEHEYGEISLLNLRQIEIMRAAKPTWGRRMHWLNTRSSEPLKPLPKPKTQPIELLRNASRIADCLLQPPKRLGPGWRVLTANLGREYGEKPFAGTPYVRHIPLVGGGLCAQAVCFMATAILNEHASGIHGLLEVTALAQRKEIAESELGGFDVYEMQISGLTYGGISRYFEEVGLRSIKQMPRTLGSADPAAAWTNRNDLFSAAARAYVNSGMPMVLTVDMGRLAAPADRAAQLKGGMQRLVTKPIFDRNGYRHPRFQEITPGIFEDRRDHAVLLVGCGKRGGSEAFLINDPSTLPFLQASTSQLAQAGYYETRWGRDGRTRIEDLKNLRSLISLPVTPAEVRLPLLSWQPENEVDDEDFPRGSAENWRDGLFAIVPNLFSGERKKLPFIEPKERFRNFRLTRLSDLVGLCAEVFQGRDDLPDIAQIRQQLLDRFGWREGHWAWIQFVREPFSIWIFDAERELPAEDLERDPDACQGFLRIGVWLENGDWREFFAPKEFARPDVDRKPAPPPPVEPRSDSNLKISALTSCSALGLEEALPAIEGKAEFIELFAFADRDFQALGREKGQSAIDFMAENEGSFDLIKQTAKSLRKLAKGADTTIGAIATYLPELATARPELARKAVGALGFLSQLGDELRTSVIEIVAGSRIHGIWPGTLAGETRGSGPVFVANVMSRAHLGQAFLENLSAVVEEMDVASPVRFAIELEPGPLHLLNDWDALVWFALQLEGEEFGEKLGARVGFNLDIGHWAFLTGIRLDDLARTSELGSLVRRRILHAHVSDHRLGHFGDLPVGTAHDEREFAPWIDFLERISRETREPGMEFSGFVSAELEASRTSAELQESLADLSSVIPSEVEGPLDDV